MCGITGILNLDGRPFVDAELLGGITRLLAHRGPDDEGIWMQGPIGLGQRRLAILDLSPAGHQPMLDVVHSRVIVFNGEIYNYRDLRPELLARGERFTSNCDTEVLLKLANPQSTDWLHQLNGMFAFALWDEREHTLLLARDRFGVKPLYWTMVGQQLVFASELKALLLHPRLSRTVREEAIPEYLAFRSLQGEETLVRDVYSLPPGYILHARVGDGAPTVARWFVDGPPSAPGTWVDARLPLADQFATLFTDAVRYRLIADVPVGTYNSGGVDSSLVTATVRGLAGGELHTFSVGFAEAGYDESHWARIVAQHCRTHHHVLTINRREFAAALPDTVWFNDEPLHHPNTVALLKLSELAREHVTVVLTGEGADETFAGYPRHQIPFLSRFLGRVPRLFTSAARFLVQHAAARRLVKLLEVCDDPTRAVIESSRTVPWSELERLGVTDVVTAGRRQLHARLAALPLSELERLLAFDRATYLPPLLHRLDRTTMAHGLEGRLPFLDFRLQDWAKTVPGHAKLRLGRDNKVLLKAVAARWFPRAMIHRRKMGFDVPIGQWLRERDALGGYLDLLTDTTFRSRSIFAPATVARLVDEHRGAKADHSELLWALLNLELWLRTFVDQMQRMEFPAISPIHANIGYSA